MSVLVHVVVLDDLVVAEPARLIGRRVGDGDHLQRVEAVVDEVLAGRQIDHAKHRVEVCIAHQPYDTIRYDTIRYDTRCCFNVRSKADMSQLNLPHGDDNEKV